MDLLQRVKQKINSLHTCDSAYILAHAAWSACDHRQIPGPSAMEVSSVLDENNKKLVFQLQQITLFRDYDNSEQAEMLRWLHNVGYSKYVAKRAKTTMKKLIDWV